MKKFRTQFFILATIVTVSNCNSFNQTWAENKRGQVLERTLDFPESFSIGRLYVFKKLDLKNHVIETNNATFRTHAQGHVNIPQKGCAFLIGNYALGESLRPLQNFKGDDLQALKLNKLTFKETDLKYLSGMTGLKRIDLESTDVGDQGLKTLAKLPNLCYITLARSLVTGKTLADLAPLTKLTELLLGHNPIGNGNLTGVAAIQNLRALRVQACQIKDKDLEPIGRLKNLESLTLHENKKITDNGLKYLAKLPKLKYLDVGQTGVTVEGLKALKNCPIDSLRLDVAQLSKKELKELKQVFPKAEIKEESTGYHMDPSLFAPLH